jgi:hypothetical protein
MGKNPHLKRAFLDEHFTRLMQAAQVDAEHYSALTKQICQTLMTKGRTDYEPG